MKKINVYSLLIAIFSAFSLNAQQVGMTIPDKTVDPGQTFSIDVKVSDFDDIVSMQFALFWDPAVIQFQSVANLNVNMPDFSVANSFNFNPAPQGYFKVSWVWFDPVTNTGVTLADDAVLFSIIYKVVGGQGTNSMLEIAPDMRGDLPFPVEITNFSSQTLDVDIDNGKVTVSGVNASEESLTEDFTLFQNSPNPFTEITYITFNLNTGTKAKLTIFDNSGKAVYQENKNFPAGLSRIPVRREMLTSAGSYFYTLETTRATATRQLIMQ